MEGPTPFFFFFYVLRGSTPCVSRCLHYRQLCAGKSQVNNWGWDSLTRKMFLSGLSKQQDIITGHPCSILSFSPCLGRGLVRWGQTGESQLWEQTQEVGHRPPALAICAPHPALRPSRRKAQSVRGGDGGGAWCSVPTRPGSSNFSDRLSSAWVKEMSQGLLQTGDQTQVPDAFSTLTDTQWHPTERICSCSSPCGRFAPLCPLNTGIEFLIQKTNSSRVHTLHGCCGLQGWMLGSPGSIQKWSLLFTPPPNTSLLTLKFSGLSSVSWGHARFSILATNCYSSSFHFYVLVYLLWG